MTKKRVLVGYGIDADAVAGWLNTENGTPQNPTNISRGIYGALVGIDRLLTLLSKYNIKATWFTPAHTIESFPEQMARVRDAGYEIGLHGYTHEYPGHMTPTQQETVLSKSIQILTTFTSSKPLGSRPTQPPAWLTTKQHTPQLEKHGIIYTNVAVSGGGKESLTVDAEVWMKPMTKLVPSGIVEIPGNWHLDDWPPFQPVPGTNSQGYINTSTHQHIEKIKIWKDHFESSSLRLRISYDTYDTFIFRYSQYRFIHRIIEYINTHSGVEWIEMAVVFKEGRIGWVEVEGGVEVEVKV